MSWNQNNIRSQCKNFLDGQEKAEGYWSEPVDYDGNYRKDNPLIAETTLDAHNFSDKQAEEECKNFHYAVRSVLSGLTKKMPATKVETVSRNLCYEGYDDAIFYCKVRKI